jgi:xylono-1,5-lactonase
MNNIISVLECACLLGEAAHWHVASQRFFWLDLYEPALFSCDATGEAFGRHALPLEAPLAALVATEDPGVVIVGHRGGLSHLCLKTLDITPFLDLEVSRDGVALNDMKVDRAGRIWVGSSDLSEKMPRGGLWCFEPDGSITLGDAGFIVSNGPAFSLDGLTMYFSDTMTRNVLAYDLYQMRPYVRSRRVAFTIDEAAGYPDGITVDSEGCIWVAHWGGARVSRWTPEGECLDNLALPVDNITSVAFGGPDLSTLLVTSAREGVSSKRLQDRPQSGAAFLISSTVAGLPEPRFATLVRTHPES